MHSSYSSFLDLLIGVPQGSNFGPLLFNIYMSDLFMFLDNDNLASYGDDKTSHAMKEIILQLIKENEDKAACVFSWFLANHFKANSKKISFSLSIK